MNKEICTNCKKEFNFSDEYDERFEGNKVFKYPRTPRRQFCGHICSIKYHNNKETRFIIFTLKPETKGTVTTAPNIKE